MTVEVNGATVATVALPAAARSDPLARLVDEETVMVVNEIGIEALSESVGRPSQALPTRAEVS